MQLEAAANITVYTHATATEIQVNSSGKSVKSVRFTMLDGTEIWVSARVFILACGGFQNARLLLLSNQQQPAGLGNLHDVVGRYYHDHPQAPGGYFIPRDRQLLNQSALYDLHLVENTPVMGFLRLARSVLEREKLLNLSALLFPRPNPRQTNAIAALKTLGESILGSGMPQRSLPALADQKPRSSTQALLKQGQQILGGLDYILPAIYRAKTQRQSLMPNLGRGGWSALAENRQRFSRFEVWHQLEQSPDPENRVVLSRDRDALNFQNLKSAGLGVQTMQLTLFGRGQFNFSHGRLC